MTNRGLIVGKANSPSLSSHELSVGFFVYLFGFLIFSYDWDPMIFFSFLLACLLIFFQVLFRQPLVRHHECSSPVISGRHSLSVGLLVLWVLKLFGLIFLEVS